MDNIGQRLKEERQLRGWSQRDLARETGVNTDTISGIETGQHEPRPSTLRKLAGGLGIEVRDLFAEPSVPLAEAPRGAGPRSDEPLISRPEVQEWLREHGHINGAEFLSWAEENESLEDVENAIQELHETRDGLLSALDNPAAQKALFPRRGEATSRKERTREAFRPVKLAWKLKWELRHEYSAREVALVNYSRQLYVEGEASDYLVYGRLDSALHHERHRIMENERKQLLERAYTEALAI